MVRTLIPKRTSKDITIEQFNEMKAQRRRQTGNNQTQAKPPRYVNLDRRHRYLKPTQKLKEIDVNVAHYINEIRTLPYSHEIDNIGSFFYDELENAKFLDLTADFQEFYAEVYDITQNLALVLYNLETIVDKMLEYLNRKDCRKTILQIFPGLFRDTQKDIFKLFRTRILPKLIEIMNQKDIDILEDLFKCLAYGLRFLYDEIKANFEDFYTLYIEKFFSSHNKHIQRFTTESLSFVIRKLKGSEMEKYIEIVMKPLLSEEAQENGGLLISHISKLFFYSIKNPQETYISKSLGIVENILKFALNNQHNEAIKECILEFIKEILTHSRPKDDKPKDEFQEKINISKSGLFEHFIKVFLQWLNAQQDIKDQVPKVQLICEIFTEMLVHRRGIIVNKALLKIIFTVVKEVDSVYSDTSLDAESANLLKKANFTVIAKLLKYKEGEIVKEKEYINFIDEKVKRGNHNSELVNLLFEKITEEIEANIPHKDYMKEGDFIVENYTLKKFSYDVLLHLTLLNFSWEQIVTSNTGKDSTIQLLNLYLFYIVHKYSNRKHKIILQNEKYRLTTDIHQAILNIANQLLSPQIKPSNFEETIDNEYMQNYIKLLLFLKYLEVFETFKEDKTQLNTTLAMLNERFYHKLLDEDSNQNTNIDTTIPVENLYELPEAMRRQFEYYVLKKDQERFSLKELLLNLKGEVISKIGQSIIVHYEAKLEDYNSFIQQELQFLLLNKNHIAYLQSFSQFLEEALNSVWSDPVVNKEMIEPYFVLSGEKVLLSLQKYGYLINELSINLSNPASDVRRYTLEILTKIQVYNFPAPPKNVETKILGECDALQLCLEIESTEVNLETERFKVISFTKLRTYTDFKRLPEEYTLVLFNFYIGTLYVRLTTLWDHAKENIASLFKLNSGKLYSELRKHILYLNAHLNPRVPALENNDITVETAYLSHQEGLEGSKSLLDIFFEDHYMKLEHVGQEEVFKSLLDAITKNSKHVENHGEDFYLIFQNFLDQEYYKTFENEALPIDIEALKSQTKGVLKSEEKLVERCLKEAIEANKDKDSLFKKSRHIGNLKLEGFLKIFISFQNVKKLSQASTFYSTLLTFLRKGHVGIQKNSLECLLKYEKEEIVQHSDTIKKFIKPESYRDQLIQFKIDKDSTELTESQRKIVVPIIIGTLYPKLFERKGRDRKSHLEANRTMVFIFFSNLEADEVEYLMSILFRNHGLPWQNLDKIPLEVLMLHLSKISLEKVSSFLETLKNIIDQLGVIILPYLPNIFKLINAAIKLSTLMREKYTSQVKTLKARSSQEEKELTEDEEVLIRLIGKWKHLYQAALKRTAQIYNKYSDWDLGQNVTDALINTLKASIETLYIDSSSNVSLLLKVFAVWSKHSPYIDYFLKYNEVFPSIVKIYAQKKLKSQVLDVINQLVYSICEFAHPGKEKEMEVENQDGENAAEVIEAAANDSKKAQQILQENVNHTIACIKTYFENQLSTSTHKIWRPSLKMTSILVHLSKYIEESSLCNDLLGLLQPLIDAQYINKAYDKRKKNSDTPAHLIDKPVDTLNGVLKVFVNFFKHSTQQERFYGNILNLLSELYLEASRESVVEMVLHLDQEKFGVSPEAIKYIEALNKYNRMAYRQLDYGNIAISCIELNQNFLNTSSFEDQKLILHQYFFLLGQEELSLRMSAVEGFKQFFEIINQNIENNDSTGVEKRILFTTKTIIPKLLKGLKANREHEVKGNLEILDMYICYMNGYAKKGVNLDNFEVLYLDLKALQNKTDPNQDFFENIFDVQNHKRVKAVTILTKKLTKMSNKDSDDKEEDLSLASLKNIIMPVLRMQILTKHLQENVLKASGSQITHAKTLVTNMIEAYSMCLKGFSWTQYFNVLKANITTLNREAKYEKVMVRLICSNLNHLDGGLPNIVDEVTKEMQNHENTIDKDGLMEKLINYDPSKALEEDDDIIKSNKNSKFQSAKLKKMEKQLNKVKQNNEGMVVEDGVGKKNGMQVEEAAQNGQPEVLTEEQQKEKQLTEEKIKHLTQQLRKKVLTPLRKHMHDLASQDNKEKKIRVYTAIAIAKLVCRFPFHLFNIEYPRLLHNLCESLKSRDFDIRSNARKALTEIALITGPYFFHYIVNELNSVLTLGYQQHVKNYTLYYLLQSMIHPKEGQVARKVEIGSFDYCLGSMLPVFFDEILGKIQEEKEVEEIKQKMPEFRTSKAYEAFQLLAGVIDAKKTFVYLINFVRNELYEVSSMLKKCNKIEEILRHVIEGLSKNPSLDIELILVICFHLIEQALESMMIKETPTLNEFTVQEYSLSKDDLKAYDLQRTFLIQEGAASGKSIFKIMQQNQKKNVFIVGRIIASFSINLILMCIKKSLIKPGNKEDPKQNSVLIKFEPLVKLLINCIKSNENNVITGSIKVLNSIATWPLNALQKNYKKIVSSALTVLEGLSQTDYDMIRVCFKLISNVFHIPTHIQLGNNQVKVLMQFIEQFMFVNDTIGDVLDCLTTTIQKKIVRPEVYDLMDKIIENMITNYSSTLQKSSKNAFLNFLVEYPMSEKLIKRYIQLFIKNLDYPGDQGRTLVIETLARIVEILPIDLLQPYFDLILYSCILKTINEENRELKDKLRKIGLATLKRIPQEKTPDYIQNFVSWLSDEKEGVMQSGLEGFLLLIWQGVKIDKHLKPLFERISTNLVLIVRKIDEHWQSLRDEIKKQKEQAQIQSKFLKKLKEENEETTAVNIEESESLGESLLRLIQSMAEKLPSVLFKYINNENKEFIANFLILVTFPKERFVIDCLGVTRTLVENAGDNLKLILPDADTVFEKVGYKLMTLFKLTFATNEYEKELTETIAKSYLLVKKEEYDAYTVHLLHRLFRILLKMMGSANLNAFRIKRILTFVSNLEKSAEVGGALTGDVLKSFLEILVRVENIKDFFVGEYDISQLVTELLDNVNKKSDTNEFIKVYSATKVKLEEMKHERKRKAKEDILLNPEEALKEKLRRKLKKKQAKKGVFGSPRFKLKKLKIQQ